MTTLTPLPPKEISAQLRAKSLALIDIRESDEYAREHIPGAVSMPLSALQAGRLKLEPAGAVAFHCRSGMRTNANCAQLAAQIDGDAFMMEGGLEAWKKAGLPIAGNAKAPLEMNRQVQISVGAMVLLGAALAFFAHPAFLAVPAFFGGGLLFAGVSGWCGLAKLLAFAPWNKRAAA